MAADLGNLKRCAKLQLQFPKCWDQVVLGASWCRFKTRGKHGARHVVLGARLTYRQVGIVGRYANVAR